MKVSDTCYNFYKKLYEATDASYKESFGAIEKTYNEASRALNKAQKQVVKSSDLYSYAQEAAKAAERAAALAPSLLTMLEQNRKVFLGPLPSFCTNEMSNKYVSINLPSKMVELSEKIEQAVKGLPLISGKLEIWAKAATFEEKVALQQYEEAFKEPLDAVEKAGLCVKDLKEKKEVSQEQLLKTSSAFRRALPKIQNLLEQTRADRNFLRAEVSRGLQEQNGRFKEVEQKLAALVVKIKLEQSKFASLEGLLSDWSKNQMQILKTGSPLSTFQWGMNPYGSAADPAGFEEELRVFMEEEDRKNPPSALEEETKSNEMSPKQTYASVVRK